MPSQNVELHGFNRGLISPLALARTDIDRVGLSAQTMTNWMPRNLGSMMLRPGAGYLGATASNNACEMIPFIYAYDDTAICEITNALMRVWVDDALVTRASVSSTLSNTGFDSDLTSWTDDDDAGATSAWVTGGYMGLTGDGTNFAKRYQTISVAGGDQATEHALDIHIQRGPVVLKVGTTQDGDDLISETTLDTGYHSLSFTPGAATVYVTFQSNLLRQVLVDSCAVASSGVMTITAPWATADLDLLRYDQSADVIYVAAAGYKQYKIERRSTTGWSVVEYSANDGPFLGINLSTITMAVAAITGNTTLTASQAYFKSTHVGALFRLTSTGQTVTSSISTENTWTDPIRITGVSSSRVFTITRAGTWSATVTLQRSFVDPDVGASWEDVTTFTTNATVTYDDTLDNQEVWYRIGVDTGNWSVATVNNVTLVGTDPVKITTSAAHGFATGENVGMADFDPGSTEELNGNSYTITVVDTTNFTLDGTDSSAFTAYTTGGTATSEGPVSLTLDYPLGNIDGIVRVTGFTSSTVVSVEVVVACGNTDATLDWYEGAWSDKQGWPSAVAIAEGRLCWAGQDSVWASASDNYTSFDDLYNDDSDTFKRSVGSGPVASFNWMVAVSKLLVGGDGAEYEVRSSSLDEILTPSNANIKAYSTFGSGRVGAIRLDNSAIFAGVGGDLLLESALGNSYSYETNDLTTFYPEASDSPFVMLAVQRKPDTRIHCVRTDGTVAILLHDKAENISCWAMYSTDGVVEDVVVLPDSSGNGEDQVYYVVQRTINAATVRYLEKWALESDCEGGDLNYNLDSYITYSAVGSATLTGLSHLEGETVYVWADGAYVGTATVSGGSITLATSVTNAIVGLTYTAQFKSSKLAYAAAMGSSLVQKKRLTTLGVILQNTHYQGLEYGPDFTNMDNLPLVKDGKTTAADTIYAAYDEEAFTFPGEWDTDARLCLQAAAPKPCTILAAIVGVETHDRL